MAVMVLCAYLTGFEKMVRIVSTIGPVIIAFTLMVGLTTVIRGAANLSHIRQYETVMGASRSAPNWLISSVLYISLNFLSGSTYFTALGMTARSRKEAKWGAVWGALTMILAIAIMNTAILLHSKDAASLAVPTLYLARHIFQCAGRCFFRCPCPGYVFLLLHHDVDGLQPFLILCARQKQDGRSGGDCICVPAGNASIQPLNQCILSLCGIYGTDLYRMRGL